MSKEELAYNKIKLLLEIEFKEYSFKLSDYFDHNVWFLTQNINTSSMKNFKEILESTPSETDDIIKNIFYNAYMKGNPQKGLRVQVENFIDVITTNLISLFKESVKLDKILESYKTYETVTKLEQMLNTMDLVYENNDNIKSNLNIWIQSIEGSSSEGDYVFSIIGGFMREDNKISALEYKLNSFIKLNQNIHLDLSQNNYYFQPIDFYSLEGINEQNTGTNLIFICLKCENLSSKLQSNIVYSQKKSFLDILLANMNGLTNIHKKNKVLETQLELDILGSTLLINLKIKINLDPLTMSSIYSKILTLQRDIISYKVQTTHKLNTILNYFHQIDKKIKKELSIFDMSKIKTTEEEKKCVIF